MEDIIFNSNPFLQRAYYVETPFNYLENWVSKEFGFKAFKSGNIHDRWIYFIIGENVCVKATPEFLDDTEIARNAFLKILQPPAPPPDRHSPTPAQTPPHNDSCKSL